MAVEVNAQRFYFLPHKDPTAPTFPSVPWFHNPIHDVESAWWIVVWALCHHKRWVKDALFTNRTQRLSVILVPGVFHYECTGIPAAILKPLDKRLNFMRAKYTELGGLVLDGTHSSFNYDEVFGPMIGYIEEIIDALWKMRDPVVEERASKRRKLEHIEDADA